MIPVKVKSRINQLMKECMEDDTPSYLYLVDKLNFVQDFYVSKKKISRWQALRIMTREPELIDKDSISAERLYELEILCEQAKESI